MHSITIGGVRVYRPQLISESRIRETLISFLHQRGFPELTDDPETINEISQSIYQFCSDLFQEAVQHISSRHLTEFLLEVHEDWGQILHKQKKGELTPEDSDRYNSLGPQARLAIQYCLEGIVQLEPSESPPCSEAEQEKWLDQMVISAEIMVFTSGQSTATHGLFPGKCQVRLALDKKVSGDYIEFTLYDGYRERLQEFNSQRSRYINERYFTFYSPANVQNAIAFLDPFFKESRGVTLAEITNTVQTALACSKPQAEGFAVCFVVEDDFYRVVSENTKLELDTVKWIFSGLILTKEHFTEEERLLWKPKQLNRLLRKPFLRMPHQLGWHLCFKQSLVQDCFLFIIQEMCFRKLPSEWSDENISAAVDKLSFDLDKEWESVVFEEMTTRGLVGNKSVKKLLHLSKGLTDISANPGEIDCLLWDAVAHSLIVVEVKRTQPTYNPAQFRDEISKYVSGDKSYMSKLDRKVSWVVENIEIVVGHFLSQRLMENAPSGPVEVSGVMITKYECFAKVMDVPYPMHSLGSLLESYDQSGKWDFLGKGLRNP
jgi:hypothetical protein